MKPELLKVLPGPAHSFSVRQDVLPRMNNRWHFHSEVELIHFHRGSGMQFVGDSILPFEEDDVVLVGANLPHYWRFDDQFLQADSGTTPFTTVAHFTETFWGAAFLNLPENQVIKTLLYKAQRGLALRGAAAAPVRALLKKLCEANGAQRLVALLECLLELATNDALQVLSSEDFGYDTTDAADDRLDAVYQYTLANFRRKITLAEIADVAGLVTNSFCRYFKAQMEKTCFRFLLEIRIGKARKLLAENELSIREIGVESGFGNNVDFHKSFKQLTGKTPLVYQREMLEAVRAQ